MGTSLSRLNNKLTFDFDTYIQERDELARDLRGLAADAAWHRRVKGSWQVLQGASGVAAGIAGGVALATAPITFGLSLPAVATTAAIVGNSITAASLASSAASYGYGHVVDKDMAKRLVNMRHVIFSLAAKDKEISEFLSAKKCSAKENNEEQKAAESSATTIATKGHSSISSSLAPSNGNAHEKLSTPSSESPPKHNTEISDNSTATTSKDSSCAKPKRKLVLIQACRRFCEAWDTLDLETKEKKKIGFDFAVALVRSAGIVLGTNSILEGSKTVQEAHDLETALLQTAETLEKETEAIRQLDTRYCSCLPQERKLPRGRLQYIDGGGGQVDMIVHFDHCGTQERLKSDSTKIIRLPEQATNVMVTFQDRSNKMVKRVDRASPRQDWVKNSSGNYELEVCDFEFADGADIIFVVKGTLTHAYIHKAWDFGLRRKPRSWEWWENAAEECKELIPDVENRIATRYTSRPPSKPVVFCCLAA